MRLLYIDVPFAGEHGGDKNRSRFLWSCLSKSFDADILLIKGSEYQLKGLAPHEGAKKSFSLVRSRNTPFKPHAIYNFHHLQIKKFKDILLSEKYDILVFRFLSTYNLAAIAAEVLPKAKIAIDVDMLFSRVAGLSWLHNCSLRNRYNLFEMLKLKRFEAKAFRKDFRFFFTNPIERQMSIDLYQLNPDNAFILENMMMSQKPAIEEASKEPYILFYGSLNSVANQDSLHYLKENIYPLIESELKQKRVKIYIAGKNPPEFLNSFSDGCIELIGEVPDMASMILNSLFVVLPLRIASGTRTRILEAAYQKKAVITTSIGVEGLDFGDEEILIKDQNEDFAKAMLELLAEPDKAAAYGEAIYCKSNALYSENILCEKLVESLNLWEKAEALKRLKIAIITNRFYPEVGGAETNIFFQATELAKYHDVTVFCPKRMEHLFSEKIADIKVNRLFDILKKGYPNLAAKTLCPTLPLHLLKGNYDIIQCFPAINYNNILAFLVAKLMKIPFIMCYFDFIDYATTFQENDKVEPDILKSIKPKFYQKLFIKYTDHNFAIANKEIDFLMRYNPSVEYSPVPILSKEYEVYQPKPKLMQSFKENAFIFVLVGRLSFVKGQDIALEAFIKAYQNMPNSYLVFVGRKDYDPQFVSKMEALIEENRLKERVFFTGMLEREEVLAWLRHSDIHIIPVRFMNSGAVVVESWISQTPVLQSNVVDPNLVIEDENGFLFQNESADDLAKKMLKAYENRERLSKMAKKGEALVRQRYTYDYLTMLYNKAYDTLLANKDL